MPPVTPRTMRRPRSGLCAAPGTVRLRLDVRSDRLRLASLARLDRLALRRLTVAVERARALALVERLERRAVERGAVETGELVDRLDGDADDLVRRDLLEGDGQRLA